MRYVFLEEQWTIKVLSSITYAAVSSFFSEAGFSPVAKLQQPKPIHAAKVQEQDKVQKVKKGTK